MGVISTEVQTRMGEAEATTRIRVILTVRGGVPPNLLSSAGLEDVQVTEIAPDTYAVAGAATPAAVRSLAGLPQVERIEYDGEMRAS